MNKINRNQIFLVSFILILSFISSCKKDSNDTTPASTTGTLMFHMHTNVDTNEVDSYGDTLVLTGGRQIAVSMAQFYISNVKLVKSDGSVIDGPSVNVLVKQGTEVYQIGAVSAGNYKSVRFDVGLSNATNASTPLSSDQTLYQPLMWFGASAQPDGFVFINFQGAIDTTDALSGASLTPFTFKIGTNTQRVTISMPDENFTVTPGTETFVHMIADYAKLFDGINLKVNSNINVTTTAQNTGSLATQLKNNISTMFTYE